MKIAHIIYALETGGQEYLLINLVNEMVKTDVVRLFVMEDVIDENMQAMISSKCRIVRLHKRTEGGIFVNSLKVLMKLNFCLWRFKPDIVNVHSRRIPNSLLIRYNIIHTIHSVINISPDTTKTKLFVAVSEAARDYLRQKDLQSIVIHNGIRINDIKNRVEPYHVFSPSNPCHLVQVGRLDAAVKGQVVMLDALHLLKEQGICNFRMHFIGSGPSKDMLIEKTKEYELEEFINFEGNKAQIYLYEHLCKYDCLIQPSHVESFGLTIAEAMAAKLPVLVSDLPGPMEVIGHGRYGMTFHCGDAIDLADKLKIVLQGGYDYSLLEEARYFVYEHFDIKKTAARYLEEYNKIHRMEKNKGNRRSKGY